MFADRFVFEHILLVACCLCTVLYMITASIANNGQVYWGGFILFLLFFSFELSMVVGISRAPLIVSHEVGHVFMSMFFCMTVIGMFVGAIISSYIYALGGFALSCNIAGAVNTTNDCLFL